MTGLRPAVLRRSFRTCQAANAELRSETMRAVILIISLLVARPAAAQADLGILQGEAVGWLQSYLRVNTVNPPGNEIIQGSTATSRQQPLCGLSARLHRQCSPTRMCSRRRRVRSFAAAAEIWPLCT